ncbi:hypothetical protein S21ZY_107 [Pseudomonas phage ZY21]|nr:hypothetical protein S21ZY_107 [Pseudomonas phage ZY21]
MKIVGKAKGKAPKAWCLIHNTKTGVYYVGYDGDWPVHGNVAQVQAKVDEAKAFIAANPTRPVVLDKVDFPGHFSHKERLEDQPAEYQEKRKAYDLYQKSTYLASQWDKQEEVANCVPLDHLPVFTDGLRFTGYTRGRSSVTMTFEASNGQTIEFGPSGIDGLLQGIIEGVCTPVELEGTYEDGGEWDRDKQEYVNRKTLPRGKGIMATFQFVKKGQNTYAELTEV